VQFDRLTVRAATEPVVVQLVAALFGAALKELAQIAFSKT